MIVKQKKCKGKGIASGFGCGTPTYIFKYGLGKCCYGDFLFNSSAGQKLVEAAKIKSKKTIEKQERKVKKEQSFELLSYPKRVQKARIVFQKWIRFRDKYEACISCGTPFAEEYHAGHYRKAELYSQLIFHEDNCRKQCLQCNKFLDGNEANYRINLVKKIGEERVKYLESFAPNKVYRYTNEELKNIIKIYGERLSRKNEVED